MKKFIAISLLVFLGFCSLDVFMLEPRQRKEEQEQWNDITRSHNYYKEVDSIRWRRIHYDKYPAPKDTTKLVPVPPTQEELEREGAIRDQIESLLY